MDDESILEIDENGNKSWRNANGDLHRLDGPALESIFGLKAWYENGLLHRLDGPAIEQADRNKEWYQNGEKHRTDGPAALYFDGTRVWYQNGKLHRLDGPAIERGDGTKEWCRYGIQFTNKESFFDAITEEEKWLALFSEDFLNG
jgi:hypothetical protein